jgi:tyrosyl-tRNA synthetase
MYGDMESIIKDYENNHLHPGDLKPALSRALNLILKPVREHFQTDKRAADLLKRVKSYKVTR